MDLEFWIWLFVAAVALLSRLRKRAKKPTPAPSNAPLDPERRKTITFQELLREIRQEKEVKETPAELEEEEEYVYEDSKTKKEEKYRAYPLEKADRTDRLEEDKLSDKKTIFSTPMKGRYKKRHRDVRKGLFFDVTKELKNPRSFRKAFIISELLGRKY